MLIALLRSWRAQTRKDEIAALASQLGPHLARDIGIAESGSPGFFPIIKPF
jgi:hypothetical protein